MVQTPKNPDKRFLDLFMFSCFSLLSIFLACLAMFIKLFLLILHFLYLRSSEGMMPREARHRLFLLILHFLYCSALAPLRLGGGRQSSATSNSLLISSFSIQNGARRRRVVRGGGGKGQGEGERSGGFGICSCLACLAFFS